MGILLPVVKNELVFTNLLPVALWECSSSLMRRDTQTQSFPATQTSPVPLTLTQMHIFHMWSSMTLPLMDKIHSKWLKSREFLRVFFFTEAAMPEPLNHTKEPGTIAFLVYQQFWTTASPPVCLSLGGSSVGKKKNKVFRALRVYRQWGMPSFDRMKTSRAGWDKERGGGISNFLSFKLV